MTKLQIDCLVADALTAMELKKITVEQFDNRIKRLEKLKARVKNE